jgi:SAM-dependent methyltransferase
MSEYALGHGEDELKRLEEQGRFYSDLTRDVLVHAGVRPGMKVLDVGCGAGDVTLLAASLVGPAGSVMGIDRAANALETARTRATRWGFRNVSFTAADAVSFSASDPFDAVVGRLVLLYLSDPAEAVRSLARCVRSGGIVAFMELDLSSVRTTPELPLFRKCVTWLRATFERSGAQVDMGTRLHHVFRAAGLAAPEMRLLGRVEARGDSPVFDNLTATLRSLLLAMQRLGVATPDEVGIDSLAERLRMEAARSSAVVIPPCVIGAWTTV